MALSPVLLENGQEIRCSRLYVSAVEHPCVLNGGRFEAGKVNTIPVDTNGVVDLEALERMLEGHDATAGRAMVAVMLANNETGVIQPVEDIARIAREREAILVVDAVQGLGKLDLEPGALGADFALLSAHKAGGPQGAGALVLGNPALTPRPLMTGGGQENRMRAGTENVAAIAGFGAAVEGCKNDGNRDGHLAIRTYLEEGLAGIAEELGAECTIFGGSAERLANTVCFAFGTIKAQTALIALDLAGIAVSSGSACSSGKVGKSHVLAAMGVDDELAGGALRISFAPEHDLEDAGRFLSAWRELAGRNHAGAPTGGDTMAMAS